MANSKLFFLLIGCFLFIDCLKEENVDVTITLNSITDANLGKKGTIAIESRTDISSFNFIDTTKSIFFFSDLTNGEKTYQINCGLWREEGKDLYTFCNYDENIPAGKYTLDVSKAQKITYKDYTLNFKADTTLDFVKSDTDIIDIYSDKQTINVEEGKENYELRFKISSYHQEPICLMTKIDIYIFYFIDCSQKNEELVCPVTKNIIESILPTNTEKIYIGTIDNDKEKKIFPLIPGIDVKYNLPKTDIFVGITKLIGNAAETDTLIAYETNITDISNVIVPLEAFDLECSSDSGEEGGKEECSCSFRKYNKFPLLMVCYVSQVGKVSLKEITQEIVLDNLNIKYNFRIQPVKNVDIIDSARASGTFIIYNYPYVLDFSQSDSLTVLYSMENPKSLTGLTFNENKGDLSCEIIGTRVQKCTVPKSHFEGKETGYYFLKHSNHLNSKSTCYESFPVKVILDGPDSSDSSDSSDKELESKFIKVSITLVYSLLLFLIMI